MNKNSRLFLFLLVFSFSSCTSSIDLHSDRTNRSENLDKPYVVLVSIDAYRFDYTDLYSPPNLTSIRKEGSSAQALLPVYPSKTFTNHYSIVTGLYAENHGIVANNFYDPERKAEFRISDESSRKDGGWYGGTPLWVAAEQQGVLAADYFWPGSDVEIQGFRPSYKYRYNESTPIEERIDQVQKWLQLSPEKRPHLITLYFYDVDKAGHKYGPRSKEVRQAVLKVDGAIGRLLDEIKTIPLPINLVIVSDHGMQEIDPNGMEYIDDYTDLSSVRVSGDGPQMSLYFDDPRKVNAIYDALKSKARHFAIYKRSEMPKKYHYSKNPRCGDLILIAEAPFSVGTRKGHSKVSMGNHGYDPDTTPTMRGIFYAKGPQIKSGKVLNPFRNIHIYPFILNILGIKFSNPIDGDEAVLGSLYQAGH